jgi:hypothetical protein
MTKLIRVFKKITNKIFGTEEIIPVQPVYKTRAQLISEGRAAYVPKRHTHGAPRKF